MDTWTPNKHFEMNSLLILFVKIQLLNYKVYELLKNISCLIMYIVYLHVVYACECRCLQRLEVADAPVASVTDSCEILDHECWNLHSSPQGQQELLTTVLLLQPRYIHISQTYSKVEEPYLLKANYILNK